MIKAAFLDRDGVINQKAPIEGEYITRWEELKILPGVAEAIILSQDGYAVTERVKLGQTRQARLPSDPV